MRGKQRGTGSTNMHWRMSGNTMIDLHVSEMPSKEYKRAHRHSSDAFVMLLSGDGYSITWPEAQYEKRVRVDWQEGTLFVPPIYWYHQHLNPGSGAGALSRHQRADSRHASWLALRGSARARSAGDRAGVQGGDCEARARS